MDTVLYFNLFIYLPFAKYSLLDSHGLAKQKREHGRSATQTSASPWRHVWMDIIG